MYQIKQLTRDEKDDFLAQHPQAVVRDYQIHDDDLSIGFYDTYEEAQTEVRAWEGRDAVQEAIDTRLDSLAESLIALGNTYGLEEDEIRSMMKASI